MSQVTQRRAAPPSAAAPEQSGGSSSSSTITTTAKHRPLVDFFHTVGFSVYFLGSCMCIHGAQLLGAPLYLVDKQWFYASRVLTKQFFGLLITAMTDLWAPTRVLVSGDASVAGLLRTSPRGLLSVDFDARAVVMANHQLYTDWLYLWWTAYANRNPPVHGHVYIILKESLKWAPLVGPAMQLYGFVFMTRKWASDQQRMRARLQKLRSQHDPMWLLIFPEGTNLTPRARDESAQFAAKSAQPDLLHQVLPRSTGLQFCLQELEGSVEYLYDCTIAYEGVPPAGYGSEIFTLRSVYLQGHPPPCVHMHWRRFRIADLPLSDHDAMYQWLVSRWREKDALLEAFARDQRFPADPSAVADPAPSSSPSPSSSSSASSSHISTSLRTDSSLEILQIFVPVAAAAVVVRVLFQLADRFLPRGK